MTVVLSSVAALEAVRDEWQALAARMRSPLLDHDWVTACASALHGDSPLSIVALRESGTLAAVAPLVYDEARRRLVLLGASTLFEPGDWLFDSPETLETLAEAVLKLGRPGAFERVPRHGALVSTLTGTRLWQAMTIVRPAGASNVVKTTGRWSDFVGRLSSRTRRSFEQATDGLTGAAGRLELVTDAPTPAAVAARLEDLVRLESLGWKGREGTALANRPSLRRFFETYCRSAAEQGRLRVTTLSAGGTLAAMELSVEAYGRRWGLKIAYAEALGRFAPALQVVHASIKAAFDEGLEGYEFLGSAEAWQERWHPERREHALVLVYPTTIPGLIRAGADAGTAVGGRRSGPPGEAPRT